MAIPIKKQESRVISIHNEPKPLTIDLPNVKPGRYSIPGMKAPKAQFVPCQFSFPGKAKIQYAELVKDSKEREYVLIRVVDAKTYVAEASENTKPFDEYGTKLSPNIGRYGLDVPSAEVANEIERQFTVKDDERELLLSVGVLAIAGEEPNALEWKEVHQRRENFMATTVQETSKWFQAFGTRTVTDQARRYAAELHNLKKLVTLPLWAQQQVVGQNDVNQMACIGCGNIVAKDAPWCTNPVCGIIYDWKFAVDHGKVIPVNVPPNRRKEAGLEIELAGVK